MTSSAIGTLVLIAAAAALAPFISEGLSRRVAVPEVVVQILLGVVLGPYVLGIAHPGEIVKALSEFGLTYLMFLAGAELDLARVGESRLLLATSGWFLSLALAIGLSALLVATGLVRDSLVIGLCLTTTALGTLLPTLKDAGVFQTRFGTTLLAVGALGEFGPIVAGTLLLTTRNAVVTGVLTVTFIALSVGAAIAAMRVRPPGFVGMVRRHLHTTSQLPVRISLLLVFLLAYLALKLGLDVLVGAFAAGIVVRLFIAGDESELVTSKLETIGYGFLIPIFFIVSGITLDLQALVDHPLTLVSVPLFLVLFFVTRGAPALVLYRRALPSSQRWALAFFASAGLPLIVAITTIGVDEGKLKPANAAALVTAGMLSVLIYPLLGFWKLRTMAK